MRRTQGTRKDRTAAIARCAVAVLAASASWSIAPATTFAQSAQQTPPASNPDEAARALEAKRQELQATETRAKTLEHDVKSLADTLSAEAESLDAEVQQFLAGVQAA